MKTIICDIDGTIFMYPKGSIDEMIEVKPTLLPGVKDWFDKWEKRGDNIILITGRRESLRERTETVLYEAGIPYDVLLMGYCDEGRILINDVGSRGQCKAWAHSLERDAGFDFDDTREGIL